MINKNIFPPFFLSQMDRLNAVGRNQFQPARPIAQMEVGKSYKVTNLRKVNPAHGPAIIVQLQGFGESSTKTCKQGAARRSAIILKCNKSDKRRQTLSNLSWWTI